MVTGIAGAIMGYVSYRKSSQIKALDLRIELKRAVVNTFKSQLRIQKLSGKYREAMAWDDEHRRQLREDRRSKAKA